MTETSKKKKIFYGGPILTINDANPRVEAIGIHSDRIISLGALNNVKKELGPNFELINLNGKTLLPGFIDSHFLYSISFFSYS